MKETMRDDCVDQVIFLSDVHFGVRNGSIEWLDNMKNYFYYFFIPFIIEQKNSGRRPCVIVAGDYFDNRQYVDINVLNIATDVMRCIVDHCDVYMMIGNHDIYKKSGNDITSLKPFTYIEGLHVIEDQLELEIKNGVKFLLTSWVGDFKKENKIITDNKDKYNYLVFHTELSGMTYDNGRTIIDGINLSIMDDNCKILSGHIHKRQESKKGLYFGSPYQLTRSDIGNQKGIYTFTSNDDGTVTKMFVPNTYSPEFKCVRFGDVGRKPEDWKEIVNNSYIDIIFTDEELDVVNVNKFLDELQHFNPKHIEVKVERTKVDVNNTQVSINDEGEVIDLNVKPDATVEEIFEVKLQAFKLKKKEEKAINKMNVEYLKKAAEELQ